MLAGCTAFQSYGQLPVDVTAASSPPASPPPCLSAGLVQHLFQQQHSFLENQQDSGSTHYEILAKETSVDSLQVEDEELEAGVQGRCSDDELAKLVSPFLTAGRSHGSQNVNLRSNMINALSTPIVSEMAVPPQNTKLETTGSLEPQYQLVAFPHLGLEEEAADCKDDSLGEKKKQWAMCTWNGRAEQSSPGSSAPRVEEELVPWLFAEVGSGSALVPVEFSEDMGGLWEYVHQPLAMAATASSISSPQPLEEGASIGGGGATTASVRGSCSPSSSAAVALSAVRDESPSPAPSSSLMLQQDSPTQGAPTSRGHESSMDLAITSRSPLTASNSASIVQHQLQATESMPRKARELCYASCVSNSNSNINPLPLALPRALLLPALPPSLLPNGASSLVHQQFLKLKGEEEQQREEGVELLNLLVACVEAISAGSLIFINHLLARLGRLASPSGSAVHRLAAYFTEGLACRVSTLWPQLYQPLLPSLPFEGQQDMMMSEGDAASAWQVLNHATPLVKFSHFTANEMILQAFEGEERVHVIDLDIKQGLQWPALFHCLATRAGGPPQHVRVTGVGECKEEVQDAGDRLAEFAEEVGLGFEFHAVVDKLEDVRLWMLHVKAEPREAVAVNCILQLHRALHDDTGAAARNLLSLIHSTRPKVVALVEQETDCHDQPSLEARFSTALRYFAALFDALDASLPAASPARFKAEALFAAHIRNILACDGPLRHERYQPLRRWQRLLAPAGFRCIPLSQRTRLQAHILLRMFSSSIASYRLLPELPSDHHQHLTLAWLDQPLFTASAWAPSP